jgi:DTW domain-containing protein YfiP
MKFTLLTHEKELNRPDNSGAVVCQLTGYPELNAQKVLWRRTQLDQSLVEQIQSGHAVLLTPQGDGEPLDDISNCEHLIILDGTWQEARKIYQKSPYLKQAKWFALKDVPPSRYNFRRNQTHGGLCTVECVIEVLKLKQLDEYADKLEALYEDFLAHPKRG